MWFSIAAKAIMWLSGIAGWLHDREVKRSAAVDVVAQAQHKAIKDMREALQVPRIDTRDELRAKFRDGDF